jgi:hypothetical protein
MAIDLIRHPEHPPRSTLWANAFVGALRRGCIFAIEDEPVETTREGYDGDFPAVLIDEHSVTRNERHEKSPCVGNPISMADHCAYVSKRKPFNSTASIVSRGG